MKHCIGIHSWRCEIPHFLCRQSSWNTVPTVHQLNGSIVKRTKCIVLVWKCVPLCVASPYSSAILFLMLLIKKNEFHSIPFNDLLVFLLGSSKPLKLSHQEVYIFFSKNNNQAKNRQTFTSDEHTFSLLCSRIQYIWWEVSTTGKQQKSWLKKIRKDQARRVLFKLVFCSNH